MPWVARSRRNCSGAADPSGAEDSEVASSRGELEHGLEVVELEEPAWKLARSRWLVSPAEVVSLPRTGSGKGAIGPPMVVLRLSTPPSIDTEGDGGSIGPLAVRCSGRRLFRSALDPGTFATRMRPRPSSGHLLGTRPHCRSRAAAGPLPRPPRHARDLRWCRGNCP